MGVVGEKGVIGSENIDVVRNERGDLTRLATFTLSKDVASERANLLVPSGACKPRLAVIVPLSGKGIKGERSTLLPDDVVASRGSAVPFFNLPIVELIDTDVLSVAISCLPETIVFSRAVVPGVAGDFSNGRLSLDKFWRSI